MQVGCVRCSHVILGNRSSTRRAPARAEGGLGAPVEVLGDAAPFAEDWAAGRADETTLEPCLRGHLLADVADGREALAVVGETSALVGCRDIHLAGARMPAHHDVIEVRAVPERDVHEHVHMLAGAVRVYLARP